ncbi:MAG: GDSL-type esterase/lipase family protein [Cytophagaceae bacterium]|jgi:lysophospholipase L1-like esterase|nr:GDSL-type esterase/lipase family protein [Cytophagaceae bacterium]
MRLAPLLLVLFVACQNHLSDNSIFPEYTPGSISMLCLGDSYTKGEGINLLQSFPYSLKDTLQTSGFIVDTLKVIAQTGWTTANLKQAIEQEALPDTFDLVTLLIGVNNQYQGRALEEYEVEFKELAEQAIGFAKGNKNRVMVISIPDYGYTPFGQSNQTSITAAINLFNASNKRLSDSIGLTYINITDITRYGLVHPDLVATDNLHPSGICYQLWVNRMLPIVKEKLSKP